MQVVGHARVDECAGSGRGGGLFGGGIGASVSCQRTDTWYLAVAGGARADQGKLERILHQADGWGRFTAVPKGTASPPVLPTTTAQWVGPAEPPPPHDKIQLELIWVASRPELASAALGAAQAQVAADRVRYLVIIKPDLAGVSRKSFAAAPARAESSRSVTHTLQHQPRRAPRGREAVGARRRTRRARTGARSRRAGAAS